MAPSTGGVRIMEHVPRRLAVRQGETRWGARGIPVACDGGTDGHRALVAWAGWLLVARGMTPSDDARLSGALYPSSNGGAVWSCTPSWTPRQTDSARGTGSSRSRASRWQRG